MVDGHKLTVESWPLAKVLPYAENARTHPPSQVAQIVGSMREFGFVQPCLVDADGVLIAGHGRLLAAKKLKMKEVPVIRLGHLSEAEARAFRLADNRIALNSVWDEALLARELAAVAVEFDTGILGFGADEVRALFGLEAQPEGGAREGEDLLPVMADAPVSQPGDLWFCGSHRVLCGDSSRKAAVEAFLGREAPHLMVTSTVGVSAPRAALAAFPGAVAYVFHRPMFTREVLADLEASEFEHRSMVIWVREQADDGDRPYATRHLQAWYVVRRGETGHWNGARDQSTVWAIPGRAGQMPVECMRRPILNNSLPGEAVYDPLLAAGATLIAAETEGRRCFGIEADPVLVDLAVRRWQDLTGLKAALRDGRTFDEVAGARLLPAVAA